MARRIIIIVLTLVLIFSSLNLSKLSFEPVSADENVETPIDYAWMNHTVIQTLSQIVKNNLTYGLHQGRLFCSEGDRNASEWIYKWMNENIDNLKGATVYKQTIGKNDYTPYIESDWKTKMIYEKSNDNIDITSLSLSFRNGTEAGSKTATISDNESYPVPKLIVFPKNQDVNSSGYQKVEIFDNDDFDLFLKETTPCSYIVMDYVNKYGVNDFCKNLVYIQDYECASPNETSDKIHLIQFDPNECEDTYMDKIQQVIDSGGDGFICISSNPLFLKNLSIPIFGISISPEEGSKILNYLEDNLDLSISFSENSEKQGHFNLYASPQCFGEKKIGLIEEHGDQPLFYTKIGPITFPWYLTLAMSRLCIGVNNYVGFILYNKTFPDVHYMIPYADGVYDKPFTSLSYSPYAKKPFLFVNGSISFDDGGSIDIWDWANDSNLKASFSIGEQRNDNATSYNVICEIPGTNQSEDNPSILISGGHHDFFWGQGAADNAPGIAVMLGILKWMNDNNITSEYDLIFISFSGEESVDRGSGFYVYNESILNDNIKIDYLFNIDFLGHRTPGSYLWIPVSDNNLSIDIFNIFSRTDYMSVVNNSYSYDIEHTNVSNDARPFYQRFVLKDYPDGPKTDLKLLELNKEKLGPDGKKPDVYYARHRTGVDHTHGDALGGIDWNDFNVSADIALNITKFLILEPPQNEFTDSSYLGFDICGDGLNDSVNISFSVTTNRTSFGIVRACLYNQTTGERASTENETTFTIYDDERGGSGYISVTLLPNQTAGVYNASIKLYDDHKNFDDVDYQLVSLSPYSKPIADFDYNLYSIIGEQNHTVNFTDTSLPSPGATISSWYWTFDEFPYHSTVQNPQHFFLDNGSHPVTLEITDSNNNQDSVTKIIEIPNFHPSASFSIGSSVYEPGQTVEFTSTSSDSDGEILNTSWNFGDGTFGYGESVEHAYSSSGIYSVTLTVEDNSGATSATTESECIVVADALVDDSYSVEIPAEHKWKTIQAGIDDVATDDGLLYVFNGNYGAATIDKIISIVGESKENVKIDGTSPGIKVIYYNVSIRNLNVSQGIEVDVKDAGDLSTNVTILNCNILDSTIGILFNHSSKCLIQNCTIQGNDVGVKIINDSTGNVLKQCSILENTYGVYIANSSNNFIGSPLISNPNFNDCNFTNDEYPILLNNASYCYIIGCSIDGASSPNGIYLNHSNNNTISTCFLHDSLDSGLLLKDSTRNKIEHSKIVWNPLGVSFEDSNDNLLVQNHFGGNSQHALFMSSTTLDNHVYYNDFIANGYGITSQAWDANTAIGEENLWSKAGSNTLTIEGDGEGNYWSDYTGSDNDEDGVGDTPYEIDGTAGSDDDYPLMDLYGWCGYLQNDTLPEITDVSATPHTVGFGYNVTIDATITDSAANISLVTVNITYPDESVHIFPMNLTEDSVYEYIFSDTWLVGQYDYNIWAIDENYNTNTSTGHHFHVSAEATISVSTLQDTYTNANEWINLTDPPEVPENYTRISQGITWNKYAAPDGDYNILETSTSPINYQDQAGTWYPINQTLKELVTNHPAYAYGYRAGNERGVYSTYFKPNLQDTWPVAFAYSRSQDPTLITVRTKMIGVGYLDPTNNWNYHILQNTQNSQGQINGNTISYTGAFTGTDLTMSYGSDELKEALIMSNLTKAVLQTHPPSLYGLSNADSYLVFITKIDAQNLALYNGSEQIMGDLTLTNNGIDFKTALDGFKCAMPLGVAYELNNEVNRQELTLRVIQYNGETYILAGLKLSDLAEMTFPVVIDPSLTIYSSSQDGQIYSANANYNTAWGATTGTVDDKSTSMLIGQQPPGIRPTYSINRAFLVFDTTQIPSNAVIDSATLGLYKVADYSTTDFDITVQNGQPTYPHMPLVTGDYDQSHYSGNGGTFNTNSFTTGYNTLTLNSQGRSWINPKEITKLCLRSSRDINRNTPTNNEYVSITSNEFTGFGCQPKLVIAYRNQSKIKNTGTTDIKGYLLAQIQFHTLSGWVVDIVVIDDSTPRTILVNHQLGLDTVFNGLIQVSDLTHGDGTYRVYAAFTDPDGDILETDTGKELVATWQFAVDT